METTNARMSIWEDGTRLLVHRNGGTKVLIANVYDVLPSPARSFPADSLRRHLRWGRSLIKGVFVIFLIVSASQGGCSHATLPESAKSEFSKQSRWLDADVQAVSVGCASDPATPAWAMENPFFSVREIQANVNFLADARLGGRMTDTPGNVETARYIAGQFADAGLQSAGDGGRWFQSFPVPILKVPSRRCVLRVSDQPPLELHKDYSPIALGTNGAFDGPLVFAGYGLNNRIRRYNDYESLSVRGAVVMVLAGEPHNESGQSRWALKGKWTRLAGLGYKIRKAADAGAVAVLIVAPETILPDPESLHYVYGNGTGPIPAIRICRKLADRLLSESGTDQSIASLVAKIEATRKPVSFAVGTRIRGLVDLRDGVGQNVVGILPADARADARERPRVLVVGAHYDHLPIGGAKAKDHGLGVRPGADDNASGIAAMIQLAKALARTPGRKADIVFVAFGAEEIGFCGSKYYVNHPVRALEDTYAMINIDQVGRMRGSRVAVIGNVLENPLGPALKQASAQCPGLKIVKIPFISKNRWSDQAPFARSDVPTLFFFTGFHRDYHRRTDTAEKINLPGVAAVARFAYGMMRSLDARGK
ncbi:MAG TPA: M20/M25/M40 family metallo-hydrolase [Phycisphaerae bacterium]|nr:M20/M25/M40 family metallo-hydrolase [Phycisphaerae bacterium]